jgi:hypothetical protein
MHSAVVLHFAPSALGPQVHPGPLSRLQVPRPLQLLLAHSEWAVQVAPLALQAYAVTPGWHVPLLPPAPALPLFPPWAVVPPEPPAPKEPPAPVPPEPALPLEPPAPATHRQDMPPASSRKQVHRVGP